MNKLLKDLSAYMNYMFIGLSLVILPIPSAVNKLIESSLPLEEIATFWQIFSTTTPLVLVFAYITFVVVKNFDFEIRDFFVVAGILIAGNLLGYATGMPGLKQAFESFHVFNTPVRLLMDSILYYGWKGSLSALVAGFFIGLMSWRVWTYEENEPMGE